MFRIAICNLGRQIPYNFLILLVSPFCNSGAAQGTEGRGELAHTLWNNLAACNLATKNWAACIAACDSALSIEPVRGCVIARL